MFTCYFGLVGLLLIGLSGCSVERSAVPPLQATGYVDDQGAVRIWRQDDSQQRPDLIVSVYTPYQGKGNVTTYYDYGHGQLKQVTEQRESEPPARIQLRFDQDSEVTYMQYQQGQQKMPLSEDDITRLRHGSRNLIEITDALRVGNVTLQQGRWQQGLTTTCEGQSVNLDLEPKLRRVVEQFVVKTSQPLGVAWLEGPQGIQLLLADGQDLCLWQPTASLQVAL